MKIKINAERVACEITTNAVNSIAVDIKKSVDDVNSKREKNKIISKDIDELQIKNKFLYTKIEKENMNFYLEKRRLTDEFNSFDRKKKERDEEKKIEIKKEEKQLEVIYLFR